MKKKDKSKFIKHPGLKCLHCKVCIFSFGRHDFMVCNCKQKNKGVFVDGGFDYFRAGYGVGWKDGKDYETVFIKTWRPNGI